MKFSMPTEPPKNHWVVSVDGYFFGRSDTDIAYEGPSESVALAVAGEARLFLRVLGLRDFTADDIACFLPHENRRDDAPFAWLSRVFLETGADSYDFEIARNCLHGFSVAHFDEHGARRDVRLDLSPSEEALLAATQPFSRAPSTWGDEGWEAMRALRVGFEREAIGSECAPAPARARSPSL